MVKNETSKQLIGVKKEEQHGRRVAAQRMAVESLKWDNVSERAGRGDSL